MFVVAFALIVVLLLGGLQQEQIPTWLIAVKYLNGNRSAPLRISNSKAPPVQLAELDAAKRRAEYLAKHAIVGPYDLEGGHQGPINNSPSGRCKLNL